MLCLLGYAGGASLDRLGYAGGALLDRLGYAGGSWLQLHLNLQLSFDVMVTDTDLLEFFRTRHRVAVRLPILELYM